MLTKLIKTASGMEVRIWDRDEPTLIKISKGYQEWLSSYKSYPVRSEDEEGFRGLVNRAYAEQINFTNPSGFTTAFSQGIEIPSEKVRIETKVNYCKGEAMGGSCIVSKAKGLIDCGKNCEVVQYATLVTDDKKEEVDGQVKEKGLNVKNLQSMVYELEEEKVVLKSQLESLQKDFNNANDLNSEKNGIILSLQSQLSEAEESNGEYHKALQNIMINERWLEMNINEVNQLLSGNKPTQD
jgi:hypothetical protein